MIEPFDKTDMPDLQMFPSAQAQDGAPVRGKSTPPRTARFRPFLWVLRICVSLMVVVAIGFGLLFFTLSRGSVSNEQLRAQMESQLSGLLGSGHSAKIDDAKIAIGKNGLLALDARNVKILRDGAINLGVAEEVAVKVKALPLARGKVVAESIILRGASIALGQFLPNPATEAKSAWLDSVDFSASFEAMGKAFSQLADSVNSAGLESITIRDTKLVGFDQLGLRSRQARLVSMKLEKDLNFQEGLFFDAVLETKYNNWTLKGAWKQTADGGNALSMTLAGLRIQDLLADGDEQEPSSIKFDSAIKLHLLLPFNADGSAQQAVMNVDIGEGKLSVAGEQVSHLIAGRLNFRLLPTKNQIELERSPVQFKTTRAILLGGLRYPAKPSNDPKKRPVFQLIATDLLGYGLITGLERSKGSIDIDGWIDPVARSVTATTLALKTPGGGLEGNGSISFLAEQPHVTASLRIPKMSVVEFKQFWPSFFAPGVRRWARDGINEGYIKGATLDADFPPGVLGNDESYTAAHIKAMVPIFDTSVKTTGDLPTIDQADAVIDFAGSKTSVSLSAGNVNLGKRGTIAVGKSKLQFGSYTLEKIPAALDLAISGKASSMAHLGTLKPLDFTRRLDINPTDLSGSASAHVKTGFILDSDVKLGEDRWSASISLKNVNSRRPFQGHRVSNANMTIEAGPGIAKINGTASIDGVPAKLALIENLETSKPGDRKITLTMDDSARKKLGIDTGRVLTGPVDVVVSTAKGGGQQIEADLRNATLSLPWIGWSKGKGIGAKASFIVTRNKGVSKLKNFQLKGKGFSAGGSLSLDKLGLRSASLNKVILNKTDDFDVDAKRVKGGFDISVNARSYDGRAIIRSFLKNERTQPKGGITVAVKGRVGRLIGFGGQSLSNVDINFTQKGKRVSKAVVKAVAQGNAPTVFALNPVKGGVQTDISTSNAGSVLRFLDLYSKVRGGTINAKLVRDKSQVFRGEIVASNFTLLGEPRLAALLKRPTVSTDITRGEEIVKQLPKIRSDKVKVDRLLARIEKGRGFLNVTKGQLSGGDASAVFQGQVYDANSRMNMTGTFLPGRSLNLLVSKIPIIGLAFGKGKVKGLLGITFRLTGRYGNPRLQVNPLSIIAPGVFREIFKF